MKTVNFTKNLMSWLAMSMLCIFAVGANAQVCSDGSTTVLDELTCEATLGITDLVSGNVAGLTLHIKLIEPSEHYVLAPGETGIVKNDDVSVIVNVPGTYKYQVKSSPTDESGCWGTFTAEDKTGPKCIVPDGNPTTDKDYYGPNGKLPELGTYEDDLAIEYVSCQADEQTIARYFDKLEADDFMDCSTLRDKDVYDVDFKFNVCSELEFNQLELPAGVTLPLFSYLSQGISEKTGEGYQICGLRLKVWRAADWDGNVSDIVNPETGEICAQLVVIVRPTDIYLDMSVTAECGHDDLDNGEPFMWDFPTFVNGEPVRDDYGYVVKDTIFIGNGEHNCKYAASYHADPIIYTCNDKDGCEDNTNTYKQARHWTVLDWCTGSKAWGYVKYPGNSYYTYTLLDEVTQIRAVVDTEAPELPKEGKVTMSQWGNPFDCDFTLRFNGIKAKDYCQGDVDVDFDVEVRSTDEHGGNSYGGSFAQYTKADALAGRIKASAGASVTVLASSWDCCGNVAYATYKFTVKADDEFAPICVANDELEVSLIQIDHGNAAHEVGARVYPSDIDEGSKDNCGIAYMKIRKASKHVPGATSLKDDEGWADYIEYSNIDDKLDLEGGDKCTAEVWVDLLVMDHNENYSICASRLILRDNTPVGIADAPAGSIYSCHDHKPAFGEVEIWGNCFEDSSASEWFTFHCPVDDNTLEDKREELMLKAMNDLSDKGFKAKDIDGLIDAGKLVIADIETGKKDLEDLWFTAVDVNVTMAKKKTEHGFSHVFAVQYSAEYSVQKEIFAFPYDYKVECSSDNIPAPSSLDDILTNKGCSEWVMNVKQDTFFGAEDACYKIIRNYEFINWCRWDENLRDDNTQIDKYCADANGDGKLLAGEDYQIAIAYDYDRFRGEWSNDGERPIRNGVELVIPSRKFCDTTFVHGSDTEILGMRNIFNDRLIAEGYFNYTQTIKVYDNEDPIVLDVDAKLGCNPNINACHQGTLEFTISATDECSGVANVTEIYVEAETSYGDEVAAKFVASQNNTVISASGLPAGTYTVHAKIEDSCGNSVWATRTEELVDFDCKKPTPIAYATFTAVMNDADCSVDVWESDLRSSVTDNCDQYAAVETAIELVSDANNDGIINALDLVDSPLADSDTDYADYQVVNVTNVGISTVALWARDASGNTQFALAPITAIDNGGNCGGGDAADIAGKITNENDEMIDQVIVSAKGSGMVDFKSIFDGTFTTSVPMNSDVTISAEKNVGHLNGVSTADLVLLQRHVLGITPLTSAYKVIAADANDDTKIDTRDMLHISRLILGIYTELPNNSSWRFVAKDHVFTNPTSPWGFVEAINFSDLSADAQADFIGIKIGDLSGNALASNLLGSDDTKIGKMNIAIEDATIAAGETQTIEFTAADFNNFAGYQFSIALDSRVEFAGVEAGALEGVTEANFGLSALENGIITTNWANAAGVTVDNGTVLFSLTVQANETVNVSEILTVNSAVTPAEAYNNDLEVFEVGVQFSRTDASFALFQNTPNPVSGETVIGFNLPSASAATLKVMDVAGRTILTRGGDFVKGYNTIALDKSELNATGVLYYQLDTENNSATMKMVILD